VCSGVEASSLAWSPLGWDAAWFSEVEPFASAVLAQRWPGARNLGDMERLHEKEEVRDGGAGGVDVLFGGTPCQSFSVAGLRGGLVDPRGNLALAFVQLAGLLWPKWVVWENVFGVLSDDEGRSFGSIVGALAGLGYGWGYRVLDADNWGLPQRRRRVFLVGHLGGGGNGAVAVLFERECLRRHLETSSEKRAKAARGPSSGLDSGNVARCLTSTSTASGYMDANVDTYVFDRTQITHPENRSRCDAGGPSPSLTRTGQPPCIVPAVSDPLTANEGRTYIHEGSNNFRLHNVVVKRAPRRLTVTECERLMGFPDGYTQVTYRGGPAKDGPRYRAIGNSVSVPVLRWLGERIEAVEAAERGETTLSAEVQRRVDKEEAR